MTPKTDATYADAADDYADDAPDAAEKNYDYPKLIEISLRN